MILDLHPDIRFQKLTIGLEKAPLLVIDQFVANPDALVMAAVGQRFSALTRYYPGIRLPAPPPYLKLVIERLQDILFEFFELERKPSRFSMCHYSLVTLPPENLGVIQRIPHVDSLDGKGLASIHYLFKKNLGGTAFYRHRKTGFESIDEARAPIYFKSLESENDGPNMPGPGYINGDTALFERIAEQDGVFNRMLVYRRNSLHSGSIAKDFVPDPNPLTGRLSINSFID
jgi:Family of unknown function (DUF6445)